MNIVEVKGLSKSFKDFTLKDISFVIPEGTITGLVGENGAGKSTTIKALLNLVHPDKGEITFWGEPLSEENLDLREQIGVVFDDLKLPESLTAELAETVFKELYRQWESSLYLKYLEEFKIPKDASIKTFSKGMRMKFQIAIALAHHPKLLIFDEATSGLDPVMRDDFLEILLDYIQDEECAVLISSHNLADIEKIADYVIFLHEGNLVFNMLKDDLRYKMGIIRCDEEGFKQLDRESILAFRKSGFQYNVLVWDKEAEIRNHPQLQVDPASIDEILLIYLKGERLS